MADIDKVLIVDDEETLTWSMSKSLSKDKDKFEVIVANSGEDALKVLETQKQIKLVITDIRMPGISGLDLLSKIRKEYSDIKVIIITAYGSPDVQREANMRGSLYYIEKPFEIKEIRKIILDTLKEERTGFEGQLSDLLLTDVIQMKCLGKASSSLSIKSGARKGKIFFSKGSIVHAETDNDTGEDAFYQILSWPEGTFASTRADVPKKITIEKDWQFLVMEGLRIADEVAKPPTEKTEVLKPTEEEEDLSKFFEHLDKGFIYLNENNFKKAKKEWETAQKLQPRNEMVKFNLKKLIERETKAKENKQK
jgi:CheY-like chemotaxis protein